MLLDEKPSRWFCSKVKHDSDLSIGALLDRQGTPQMEPRAMLRVAAEYYETLSSEKTSCPQARREILENITKTVRPDQAGKLVRSISMGEIRSSIRRAALGKSPGPDGLPSELYKAVLAREKVDGTDSLLQMLCSFFNTLLETGTTSEGWTNGILTMIYKNKGDKRDLSNYRPLSIMNVDYKLYTDILMQRRERCDRGTSICLLARQID